MDAQLLDRYADLIVSVGANVQPDQVLAVEALPEAQPLVAAIARRAYEKGARYVDVQYFDGDVKRIRAERRARASSLDWVPPWLGRADAGPRGARCGARRARADRPAGAARRASTRRGPARTGCRRSRRRSRRSTTARSRGRSRPTRRGAGRRSSIPDLDADEALERLWQDVAHVCRLDEPDPAAAWQERIEQIWQVASRLDALDLDSLRFDGPGTDLTVGLLPSSRFAKEGGSSQTRTGVRHVPNIPTEEVYTTPDPERTEGVVTATKPLDVSGSLVTGLRVRFEGGRAVRSTPIRTPDALRQRCSVDDGASRLGEVALVDRESRIGRLGRTFFTTLLDENAASHLALGDAYSAPIGDPADLPHINESAVHIDFMIGSDDVDRHRDDEGRRAGADPARRQLADLIRES